MLSGVGVAGAVALASPAGAQGAAAGPGAVRVTDFMSGEQLADLGAQQPSIDCGPAFQAAWNAVRTQGGVLLVPPGNYMIASTWHCEITSPANIMISGWGARLFAGPAMRGPAMIVRGSFNEYALDIEGLAFDHRGNSAAAGCIDVVGGHCVQVRRCVLEYSGVRPDYRFIRFAADQAALRNGEGRDDRNSFWCKVEGCSIRRRSGSEPGQAAAFAQVVGSANAVSFVDNCIQHCAVGLAFEPDPETGALANGVVIDRNFFEGIATVGIRVTIARGRYGPTGMRIVHNRFETCPVAFEVVSGGDAKIHSQPPFLFGNYYTTGSVDSVLRNPSDYPISVFETRYPGFGPPIDNDLYLGGNMQFRFDQGKNMHLAAYDGSANRDRAKLVFGRDASLWFDPSDGRLYAGVGSPQRGAAGNAITRGSD